MKIVFFDKFFDITQVCMRNVWHCRNIIAIFSFYFVFYCYLIFSSIILLKGIRTCFDRIFTKCKWFLKILFLWSTFCLYFLNQYSNRLLILLFLVTNYILESVCIIIILAVFHRTVIKCNSFANNICKQG